MDSGASRKRRWRVIIGVAAATAIVFGIWFQYSLRTPAVTTLPTELQGEKIDITSVQWVGDKRFLIPTAKGIIEYDLALRESILYPIEGQAAGPITTMLPTSPGRGRAMIYFNPAGMGQKFSPSGIYMAAPVWIFATQTFFNLYKREHGSYVRVGNGPAGFSFVGWKDDDTLLVMNSYQRLPTLSKGSKAKSKILPASYHEWKWREGGKPLGLGPVTGLDAEYTPRGTLMIDKGTSMEEYGGKPLRLMKSVATPREGGVAYRASPFMSRVRSFVVVSTSTGSSTAIFQSNRSTDVDTDMRRIGSVDKAKRPSGWKKLLSKLGMFKGYSDDVYVLKVTDVQTKSSREICTFPRTGSSGNVFIEWIPGGKIHVALDGAHYLVELPQL